VPQGDSPGDSSLEKTPCDLCNTARVHGCDHHQWATNQNDLSSDSLILQDIL